MVMSRLSYLLADFAAGRWASSPEHAAQEWHAELYELERQGKRFAMLRFALSLALSRRGRADAAIVPWRPYRNAALLVLGPLVCLLLALPSMFPLVVVPIATGVALIAYRAGLRNPFGGWRSVPSILVPVVVTVLLSASAIGLDTGPWPVAVWFWLGLLTVVVLTTAVVPTRLSLPAGLIGAVAAAWITSTVLMWHRNLQGWHLAGDYSVVTHLDTGAAAWWFPAALTGLPDLGYLGAPISELPNSWIVADYLESFPHLMVLIGVYSVSFLAGSRQADLSSAADRSTQNSSPSESGQEVRVA